MSDPDQRFRQQLKRQIAFIERSCAAYDEGHTDEATRIATVVRVLIHNTRQSASLLSLLKSPDIQLLSTSMDIVAHFDKRFGKGTLPTHFDGVSVIHNGKLRPKLGDGGVKEYRPVESWWLQPVIILEHHPYTRRDIVLNVANKDGGAHVDAKLTPEYENLIAAGSLGEQVELTDAGVTVTPIPDAHFSALRQIGFELLNSEQLLNLRAPI